MKYPLCFCYYDRYFCVYSVNEEKRSGPFSMTKNPITFPCISNNKSYSFWSSVSKIYFYENGLNSNPWSEHFMCRMHFNTSDDYISCRLQNMLPGKKVWKKPTKSKPNLFQGFSQEFIFPFFIWESLIWEKKLNFSLNFN